MLTPNPDELIHSFIYRVHKLNGDFKIKHLIGNKGHWMSFPKIAKGTFKYYKYANDKEILSMLREIGIAEPTLHSFENPTRYLPQLQQFFRGTKYKTGAKSKTQPIKYCLKCTQSSMVENGFVFIHKDWYQGTYCSKHNCLLSIVLEGNREKALNSIHDVFAGKHAANISYCEKKTPPKLNKKIPERYFAPCLVNSLKHFISSKRHEHPDDLFKKSYYSDANLQSRAVLYQLYNSLEAKLHPTYVDFLERNAQIKVVNTGVIRVTSQSESILKNKMSSCLDCMESHISCALAKNDNC